MELDSRTLPQTAVNQRTGVVARFGTSRACKITSARHLPMLVLHRRSSDIYAANNSVQILQLPALSGILSGSVLDFKAPSVRSHGKHDRVFRSCRRHGDW